LGGVDQQIHPHNEEHHRDCASCYNAFFQLLPVSQLVTNTKAELYSIHIACDDFLDMTINMVVLEGCVDKLVWYGAIGVG